MSVFDWSEMGDKDKTWSGREWFVVTGFLLENLTFPVAEWIRVTLFGIILPPYKTKRVHFWGLMNSATKYYFSCPEHGDL